MSFPLLRLPCLALEVIIKFCDHEEILFLVQTSQRARRLISRHTKSHSIEITVTNNNNNGSYVGIFHGDREFFRIYIKTQGENFHEFWRFKTLVPVLPDYQKNLLFSRWTQIEQAFQEILDFLNEIFRIKEVSFKNNVKFSCRLVPIAEHVVSKNLKIGSVDWQNSVGYEPMAERILMVSKGATNFKLEKFNFFSFRFYHFHLFKMDRFEIEHAEWMTVDQVIALWNCKQIRLGDVWFDSKDINTILWEYIEDPGELLELRLTSRNDIRIEDVVTGLNAVEVHEGNHWKGRKFRITGQIRFSVTVVWGDNIVITREP
uniref:F-box domain-containing protein n=1 Tax=Caenorhabditis tropicalis TaxID=1561998 RepID=A0A1I7UT90_9PELO